MKKIISSIIILLLINNIIFLTYAVNTNEQSSPWTIEKAEHLAKKVLFGASKEKVLELFNAGSASAAVNILFPSINGPDRTIYNTKMASILDNSWLIETNKYEMRDFYTRKRIEDPYEAKMKLHGLFEDIFSVNTIRDRINYGDIESTYDLLYNYTLGNYKDMIKRNLYNNGNPGDYSLGEYLDLFNQKKATNPNENYSREMLQLFMMLEYKPTESEDLGSTRNYTETDVNKFAKILFGFEADENTHKVTYNKDANTNTIIEFLDGGLKLGDSFPFYDSNSGTLNIQKMKDPINGNNGLPDNIVDYIFSKREDSIAIFLADKLFRFYIDQKPTRAELDIITAKIKENNFEIFPTIKWLLSSNIMYSSKSMNDVIYKNPLELVIGTVKILKLNPDNLDFRYILSNLGWIPYGVGKIFGRDGYDNNSIFFTSYIGNKWTTESSVFSSKLIDTNLGYIDEQLSATGIVDELTDKLYLGKIIDNQTKQKLIDYLLIDKDGNNVNVDFTDNKYIANNIQGLIYLMLNMPEYVLQSGFDKVNNSITTNTSFYKNDSKLIFIKASGGLDWLHVIIPKNEYSKYLNIRGKGALIGAGIISLDANYYINSALVPFKGLYDNGNLKIINRIGTPNNSRGHDSALRKITSMDDTYKGTKGIFGDLIKNDDPSKTIVLAGSTKPLIFRNGSYLGIGSSALFSIKSSNTSTNFEEKEYKIATLKNLLINRKYVGDFGKVFKNSAVIDSVARNSVLNGGKNGSGYNMKQKFTFIESLYKEGLGNTSWLRADGGYDTHKNEKNYLNNNLKIVSEETTNFFNRIKDKYNVTIVIYSEFGRTNNINSGVGTDHGMGSGMFIISNNTNLINTELPKKIYGNNSFKNSKNNWLGVGIDYRSVYSSIYKALYNYDLSAKLGDIFNINTYIDKNPSKVYSLWINNIYKSSTLFSTYLNFKIDDINFFSDEASYLKFEYWTNTDSSKKISNYWLDRSKIGKKNYSIKFITTPNKKYYYKLTIYDNQFNEKLIEGEFKTPNNQITLNKENSTFLYNFRNTKLNTNKIILDNSSNGIILSNTGSTKYYGNNKHELLVDSGTYIKEITGNIGSKWDGVFLNPIEINPSNFIGDFIKYKGKNINLFKISKLIKVGAESLGIGFGLNKKVTLKINNISSLKNYIILTSEDGIIWNKLENADIINKENQLSFKTDHFSYFLIMEVDSNGNLIGINDVGGNDTGGNDTGGNDEDSTNTPGGGGSYILTRDKCEFGDLSLSYYDNICGIEQYKVNSYIYDSMYKYLKNDLKKEVNRRQTKNRANKLTRIAYVELKVLHKNRAKIYNNIFNEYLIQSSDKEINNPIKIEKLISQKEILFLMREGLSYTYMNGVKIIHIKSSEGNKFFEALTKIIFKKNFNDKNKIKLLKILNNVIIYSAIRDLKKIDKRTKNINSFLLKKEIKLLLDIYKLIQGGRK